MTKFEPFPKIPRLSRECVITEKIDGTNASVWILDMDTPEMDLPYVPMEAILVNVNVHEVAVIAGSRKRFITPQDDNFGFARWVYAHAEELVEELGYGTHFGEWWGSGIQRGYGLEKGEKRFSLFNTGVWKGEDLNLCHVVPVLHQGMFTSGTVELCMENLQARGSSAAPGFMNPEGVMIYHSGSRGYFKKTFEGDEGGKG